MKTDAVKALVAQILPTLPQPYTEHVIDDVFYAIETTPAWLSEYESCCATLGRDVVNNWTAKWAAIALGKLGERQVPRRRSKLITGYSLLDTDARTLSKPNEHEAREMMFAYYREHKGQLPDDISKYRGAIIELLIQCCSHRCC
ncbi:MAG: hypothetical protein V4864_17940 [Pseudomonadota bacterium]